MKIISRNVNGIRAVLKKWFLNFLEQEKPDIFAIQETKAFQEQIPTELAYFLSKNDYSIQRHNGTRPWYAGTAIFYKNWIWIKSDIFFENNEILNQDWRITNISLWGTELLNIYFPNGWTRANGTEMLSYKLSFYDELIKVCKEIKKNWKNVILCWDFNICHEAIDIARPEANKNSIWFLPIEREKFTEFLSHWYVDLFRNAFPQAVEYTWRSYRAWARARNVGRRIDYFVVNEDLVPKVKKIKNLTYVLGSDHCPVLLEIE